MFAWMLSKKVPWEKSASTENAVYLAWSSELAKTMGGSTK